MSGQFQVDTDRIQSASVDIATIAGDIESQVQSMMGRLNALEDAWRGAAAAQFQGVVAQWQGTQTQVKASLDSIGQVLGQAGEVYADTEAQAVRMFS
ncbi:MAG TPA: WXG100 family type VII secretion target [Phycicoccus sp.]|nr:WXG100 family type VII secretion target [Phycicoccus sp.]HQH08044.1 WXG100 family type VII secretion target [Phycicoccus sp.]HQK31964.1 WXG100 family type VII secretion target [Phycicoccus sp.]